MKLSTSIVCGLLFSISTNLSAQIGFVDGFIIKNTRDTIFGKIYATTPHVKASKIIFKANDDRHRVTYRPFQIHGYGLNGEFYESRIYDIHPSLAYGLGVFMIKRNEEGPVYIYEYWNSQRKRGYTQTFLIRPGEGSFELGYMRWKHNLALYFEDYKDLSEQIMDGTYKKRDLLKIVETYNQWVRSGTANH